MSAGSFLLGGRYESNNGTVYPIRVQPETLGFTLNSVSNALPTGQVGTDLPSVRVGAGRNAFGVNARLIRFTFTGTLPPGYKMNGILTLPVLTSAAYNLYSRGQAGTYTLNGTEYAVAFVGKSPETIK